MCSQAVRATPQRSAISLTSTGVCADWHPLAAGTPFPDTASGPRCVPARHTWVLAFAALRLLWRALPRDPDSPTPSALARLDRTA
jgi:hypothetical protein